MRTSNFLLTWSQIPGLNGDTDWEDVIEQLYAMLSDMLSLSYCVICYEHHDTTDGYHIHAFCECSSRPQIRINQFEFCGRVPNHENVRATRTDKQRSINYVKKDGKWKEYGERPLEAQKKEFKELKELALTTTKKQFYIEHANTLSHMKMFDLMQSVQEPYDGIRKVLWFHGDTGTGKTKKAVELAKSSGLSWTIVDYYNGFFNGYIGEEFVIIDDIRAGTMRFELLLRITDRYPIHVNVKGSTMPWRAKVIIITAPVNPNEMFVNHETQQPWDHLDQLIRRLQEFGGIYDFNEESDPEININ